jgi:hypothetical protein
MFSYVKSLIALGLAVVVLLGLGFWFQRLSDTALSLQQEKRDLDRQVEDARTYPQIINALETRLRTLKDDIAGMAERFAEKDNPGPQLVTAVVKTAGAAGMEMTRTTENVSPDKVMQSRLNRPPDVTVISYEFGLRGKYAALVLFLQNMASWKLAHKLESMEISCPDDLAAKGQIDVTVVVSVFSSSKLDTRKSSLPKP